LYPIEKWSEIYFFYYLITGAMVAVTLLLAVLSPASRLTLSLTLDALEGFVTVTLSSDSVTAEAVVCAEARGFALAAKEPDRTLGLALVANEARWTEAGAVDGVADAPVEAIAPQRTLGAVEAWGAGPLAVDAIPARAALAPTVLVLALAVVEAAASLGAVHPKEAPRTQLAAVFALIARGARARARKRVADGVVLAVARAWTN